MTDAVARLAERAGVDPHFLAFALNEYRDAEKLDDATLAARLGTTPNGLTAIRLCRMPRPDAAGFRDDVTRIAGKFGLNPVALAEVARRGQTVAELRRAANEVPAEDATVSLAARDREGEP